MMMICDRRPATLGRASKTPLAHLRHTNKGTGRDLRSSTLG